jgi:hypothetical protein
MSKVFAIFTEKGGEFSWRKIMTAACLFLFLLSVTGWLIKHDFDELPTSYQAIIAGVFAFYFAKTILEKVKLTTDENKTT